MKKIATIKTIGPNFNLMPKIVMVFGQPTHKVAICPHLQALEFLLNGSQKTAVQ